LKFFGEIEKKGTISIKFRYKNFKKQQKLKKQLVMNVKNDCYGKKCQIRKAS